MSGQVFYFLFSAFWIKTRILCTICFFIGCNLFEETKMRFLTSFHSNLIEILLIWIFKTDKEINVLGLSEGFLEEALLWYGIGVILINLAKISDYVGIIRFFINQISLLKKIKGKTCFECKRPLKSRDTSIFAILLGLVVSLPLDYKGEQDSYFVYHTPIDAEMRECGHMFHKGCLANNISECSYCK